MNKRCDKCFKHHSSVEPFESKLLINQYKLYNLCDDCFVSENSYEDDYIKLMISRNEALNTITKASYYKDYCKSPIEIKEIINKENKNYVMIDENEYYYLLSCLSNKVVETIDKIKLQHKRELQKIQKIEIREVKKDAKIKDLERKEQEKKEHLEEKINKEIEVNRMQNEIINNKKDKAIKPYLGAAQKDNIELKAVKCSKCNEYKCEQYDFTNDYDYKYYVRSDIKGGKGQTFHYKICNDCCQAIKHEREEKTINCPCGLTYYARNRSYIDKHMMCNTHRAYEEKLVHKVNFDLMKLNELLEINKKYNLNIANYQKIGKKNLALEIKKLYDEKKFEL